MKAIELVFLPDCPYCVKAKRAIAELKEENEIYATIPVKWINEEIETDFADSHDYYYVPTIFFNDTKLFEACPGDSYEKIKAGIKLSFDKALSC